MYGIPPFLLFELLFDINHSRVRAHYEHTHAHALPRRTRTRQDL
jgi:hypothetical protein